MSEEDPPLPIEIPWRLAATTQPLTTSEPDQTSISLFMFKPDEDELTGKFPGERLVYLKFTVSVSPASIPNPEPVGALGEGVPCFHLMLDVRVRKSDGNTGTIRPYFHSAAPIHRSMVETGIVGIDVFEGESDLQFMGRSGSQMYESSSSQSRTTTVGGGSLGIGPVSIGGSIQNTSTNVSAQRGVSQVVDTTQRQASEERRQLTSHSMKIENVLTLLNAKYVGTPHLRFSLSPRPLHLLSAEPSDLNIWFSQLLQRRSSGIEGIQEFTTILLVPKDQDFCVDARLRRVCVLDKPPGPLVYPDIFDPHEDLIKSYIYLARAYPKGTHLDELDIDITGPLQPADPNTPNEFIRPVIEYWAITGNGLIIASVVSQGPGLAEVKQKYLNYKHILEIWRDSIHDEYEREVARSPLERGILLGEQRQLDTCFSFTGSGGISVTGSSATVSPLFRVRVDPRDIDIGGVLSASSSARMSEKERSTEALTRWNLLENRMAIVLTNQKDDTHTEFRFDDDDIVRIMIDRLANLTTEDPHNITFENAVKKLGLNDKQWRKLKAAGATNLKSIAQAIRRASDIERYNSNLDKIDMARGARRTNKTIKPIKYDISSKDAIDIRKAIGKALQKGLSNKNVR